MRSLARRTLILGAFAGAGVVWSGCEAKQATEYVGGISTQVQVPRDLKAIRLDVTVGGVNQFCQGYKVYDGKVLLPGSLGSYAATVSSESGPVSFTISGVASDDLNSEIFANCGLIPSVGQGSVRILRRSRQPYIKDEIRFLPLPLKYSCFDKQCGDGQTCKGGKCVSDTLSEEQARATFPPYTPGLVDGSEGGCFSVELCMGAAFAALAVDTDTCTYAVPASANAPPTIDPSADPFRRPCTVSTDCTSGVCTGGRCEALKPGTPWEGTNVEVVYDGGLNREILDLDPEEGFVIPDPSKPQQFKLAPGLCEMVRGLDDQGNPTAHRITAVRASGTCKPKRLAQPFCTKDGLKRMGIDENGLAPDLGAPNDCRTTELKSPRSALMIVVDNTAGHSAFFNADEIRNVALPLRDPAFDQTEIGLMYAPVATGCATDAAPAIPFEPARAVRPKVVDSFLSFATDPTKLVAGTPSYEGVLASAYAQLLGRPADTYKRAVVILGNREFDADACPGITGTPSQQALAARTTPSDPTKPIRTYVIQLAKSDPNKRLDVQPPDPAADVLDPGIFTLVQAGSATPPNPDARGTKKNAKDAFQQVINALATCTYDVPAGVTLAADDVVTFSNPVDSTTTKVPPNAGCNAEGVPGSGWGFSGSDTKRIHLCQDSCTVYRNTLALASDFALLYQQPPYAVPVFAHKKGCEPK